METRSTAKDTQGSLLSPHLPPCLPTPPLVLLQTDEKKEVMP
jgi:hypothetical protein